MKQIFFLVVFIVWLPYLGIGATTCADLDSPEKILAFVKKAGESNPLVRANVSLLMNISPCQGKLCFKPNKTERKKRSNTAHILRKGNKSRVFFIKGPHAPRCLITNAKKRYLCSKCDRYSNELCRSFRKDETSTTIRGTNIDLADFERLYDENHVSKCESIPSKEKYLKIITMKQAGDSPYGKIITFYDAEKAIPITMNFFAKGVLRKEYRFFPKYYAQIQGEWISTVARIRSTQGHKNKYNFETLIRIPPVKGSKGKYQLYMNPKKDPSLKQVNYNVLFSTN